MAEPASNIGGKMARRLDPDLNPWDQQPDESDQAYKAFLDYRDMEERKVAPSTMSVSDQSQRKRWSATWLWSYRARAWDRQVSAEELEDLARYRSRMHRNHRNMARVAQAKFVEWLQTRTTEDVSRWKPADAIRIWEAAVRIEREASGMAYAETGELPEQNPFEAPDGSGGPASLSELFGADPDMEQQLSQVLHEILSRGK